MKQQNRFSPEVSERAGRVVFDHDGEYDSQWSAIVSISSKIGCNEETIRRWVHRTEIDLSRRGGRTSEDRSRIKEIERENRKLRWVNKIRRKASAFFAQAGKTAWPQSDPKRRTP